MLAGLIQAQAEGEESGNYACGWKRCLIVVSLLLLAAAAATTPAFASRGPTSHHQRQSLYRCSRGTYAMPWCHFLPAFPR